MANTVEQAISILVDKPMIGSRRIVDMEAFSFGAIITPRDAAAGRRLLAEYDLHVQCPWRIVCMDQILVGYRDMSEPPTGVSAAKFDPNEARITRRDELLEGFFAQRREQPRRVVACTGTSRGDVHILFDDACVLELFPDASAGGRDLEFWRLLLPNDTHLVVSAQGLERLPAQGE